MTNRIKAIIRNILYVKALKYKQLIIRFSFITICIIFFFYTSFISYNIGNIFFGDVPKLYNVTLANFFFVNASYPAIGKPVMYAHYQLSRTHFIAGDLKNALKEAEIELEIYPENTRTYYILGLTYGYLNLEEEAIDAFSKFIETHPHTWAGRNDKAWLQFRIGDIDEALKTIEPVATSTLGINNVWVQNTYGTLLMNKNRLPEAKEAFKRAEQLANTMTEESWGFAYPGNDPRIYSLGLKATKLSVETNLKLIEEKIKK